MKSILTPIFAVAFVISVGLGCGAFDRGDASVNNGSNVNKSITDRAVDAAVGEEKTGIAECDEVIATLAAQANNPDDNFVVKAAKQTALNQVRNQIKQELERNKTDNAEVAKFCREMKSNLERFGSDPENANTSR